MLWGIVLSFTIAGGAAGVLADTISLFNVDPGAPVSAYEAGVTNGVTTYLLACNASASATGVCDFTAPVTLIEGPSTFHVAITKPLSEGVVQSLTVDCPQGTGAACSVTALNTASQTTTISFPAVSFSAGITGLSVVASPQALLYNGIAVPTTTSSASSSTSASSSSLNSTITSTSSSTASATLSATGVYANSTTGTVTKGTVTKAGPSSSTSSTTALETTTKSGAGSMYMGAQAAVYAGLVAVVFLAGNL